MRHHTLPAVLFDFGQVLTSNQDRSVYTPYIASHNLNPQDFFQAWWKYRLEYDRGSLGTRDYWRLVLAGANHPAPDTLTEVQAGELVELDIASFNNPRPGMKALIQELSQQGIPMGILSNMPPGLGERWRQLWPWIQGFSLFIWSGDVKKVKPDGDVYQLVLDTAGWVPEKVLFLDDLELNITAAQNLGFAVHHFIEESRAIETVRQWVAQHLG